jgi:hypothetical protein
MRRGDASGKTPHAENLALKPLQKPLTGFAT